MKIPNFPSRATVNLLGKKGGKGTLGRYVDILSDTEHPIEGEPDAISLEELQKQLAQSGVSAQPESPDEFPPIGWKR